MGQNFPCPCGAQVAVGDEADAASAVCSACGRTVMAPTAGTEAGSSEQAPVSSASGPEHPKERICLSCGRHSPIHAVICPHCHHKAGEARPKSSKELREARRRLEARTRAPVGMPWEVVASATLLFLGLTASGLSIALGGGSMLTVVGLFITFASFLGLLNRTKWGWWLTISLCGLNGSMTFVAWHQLNERYGRSAIPDFVNVICWVIIGLNAGVLLILIRCQLRGAYLRA